MDNDAQPTLTSGQRSYLRGLAQHIVPAVMVGKKGLTDSLIEAARDALEANELIKVRFTECKGEKREITADIASGTDSQIAGIIGHVAILYRQQPEEEKRRIELPVPGAPKHRRPPAAKKGHRGRK